MVYTFTKCQNKFWCKRPDLQWETHRTLPILRLSALATVKACFQNLKRHVTVYRCHSQSPIYITWITVVKSPAIWTTETWIKDREQEQQWSMRSPQSAATFCSPETLFHDQHVDQVDIVCEMSSISEQGLHTQASTIPAMSCMSWKPGYSPQDISSISLIQT